MPLITKPELDWISVSGFRSIAKIEALAIRPVNIIVGANGSGKSNFIGVFSFLHALREGHLQEYVRRGGGADQILHFGSKRTEKITIEISFRDAVNGYHVELVPNAEDSLVPLNEWVLFWDKSKYSRPYSDSLLPCEGGTEAGISSERLSGIGEWVRTRLARWRLYHVHDTSHSSPLRKTALVSDNAFLRPDGRNLPAFLYRLKLQYKDSYARIKGIVKRVAPFFDDFHLEPEHLNLDTIRLAWRHVGSEAYFNAASLSDGSLRFIALTTLLMQPQELRPSVILLDEPELGLHPVAIALLADELKEASRTTQVIVSTQSPLLLDHFDPDDVLVAERSSGATSLRRLSSDQLAKWLDEYSLGQLWEKNELGGRPSPD